MVTETRRKHSLRIATCPVNWNNNDIPGWKPLTPFPEILDRMQEAGYSATEYDASFGDDAGTLVAEATRRGMAWIGSYHWVDFLERGDTPGAYADLIPTLTLLQEIGCRNLIVADSLREHRVAIAGRVPANGSASLDATSYDRIAAGVHALAALAATHDISIRYHNHVGTWIEAPHEVTALLDRLDTETADLCFDTGHYAYGGGDPGRFIAEHIDAVGYLHLKDVDASAVATARERGLGFLEALRQIIFSPLGAGTADIPAILRLLTNHEFKGWLVVEQDTCSGDPTDTAATNLAYIGNWLRQHDSGTTSGR